jgi:16S rRNA (uracil1498-N3)-methyltransferase
VVLIGPEGDFTPEEVRLAEGNGFVGVSLGQARLRTETAGLLTVSVAALAG